MCFRNFSFIFLKVFCYFLLTAAVLVVRVRTLRLPVALHPPRNARPPRARKLGGCARGGGDGATPHLVAPIEAIPHPVALPADGQADAWTDALELRGRAVDDQGWARGHRACATNQNL